VTVHKIKDETKTKCFISSVISAISRLIHAVHLFQLTGSTSSTNKAPTFADLTAQPTTSGMSSTNQKAENKLQRLREAATRCQFQKHFTCSLLRAQILKVKKKTQPSSAGVKTAHKKMLVKSTPGDAKWDQCRTNNA